MGATDAQETAQNPRGLPALSREHPYVTRVNSTQQSLESPLHRKGARRVRAGGHWKRSRAAETSPVAYRYPPTAAYLAATSVSR